MEDSDVNAQILEELKRMNRLSRQSLIWGTIVLIVFLGYVLIRVQPLLYSHKHKEATWSSMRNDIERGAFVPAIATGKALIDRTPDYYYPHSCLGTAYLAKGDLENAKKEFETAFSLWPSEENEKSLKTIEKRIEMEQAKKK